MPKWMHERADHIMAKNPSMPESEAFAIATQQMHSLGKTPRGYGTLKGKETAKKKFNTPKDDEHRAAPKKDSVAEGTEGEKTSSKEKKEKRPNLKKFLVGTGAGAGLMGAHHGLHRISMREGEDPSLSLWEKVKAKAPHDVEILNDAPGGPHFHGGTTTPLGIQTQSPARGVREVHGAYVSAGGNKIPSILAHELGHADINKNLLGRIVQNPITTNMGFQGTNLGGLIGLGTGFSDNPNIQKAGVLAPLALNLPVLAYEAAASLQGLRRMHGAGANTKELLKGVSHLLPAWGTYAARAGIGSANAYSSQGIAGVLKKHIRRADDGGKTAAVPQQMTPPPAMAQAPYKPPPNVIFAPKPRYQYGGQPPQIPMAKAAQLAVLSLERSKTAALMSTDEIDKAARLQRDNPADNQDADRMQKDSGFSTNSYSGPMNPVIASGASVLPPGQVPGLRSPLQQSKIALDKEAIIERLVRLGATDIPSTPRLLMRQRSPEELGALQQSVTHAFQGVENPMKSAVGKLIAHVPHEGAQSVLTKGTNALIENPELLPLSAVPLPGVAPGWLAAKKGVEKAIDHFSPAHTKVAYTRAELVTALAALGAVGGGAAGYQKGKETEQPLMGAARGALGGGLGTLGGGLGTLAALSPTEGQPLAALPGALTGGFAGYKALTHGMHKKEAARYKLEGDALIEVGPDGKSLGKGPVKLAAGAPTRGNFMQASDIPSNVPINSLRAPLIKNGDMLPDYVTYDPASFKKAKLSAGAGMNESIDENAKDANPEDYKKADVSPSASWHGGTGGPQRQASYLPNLPPPSLLAPLRKLGALPVMQAAQTAKTIGTFKPGVIKGPSIADQSKPKGMGTGGAIPGATKTGITSMGPINMNTGLGPSKS